MGKYRDISLPAGQVIIEIHRWFPPGSTDPAGMMEDLEKPVYYLGKIMRTDGNFPIGWLSVTESKDSARRVDEKEAISWANSHPFYKPVVIKKNEPNTTTKNH